MITVAQARSRLIDSVDCELNTETVSLSEAIGRVVSRDVVSQLAIPPASNSAMDGFAVKAENIRSDGVTTLSISQRIPAGQAPASLAPNTAARIFTGGLLPQGADAVVIQENCEFDARQVSIQVPVSAGDNVRPAGQDIQPGATVVKAGDRLSAISLSLLASIGVSHLEVYRPLKIAIFSTGDELVEPSESLAPGQIYNSNRPLLIGLCEQLGANVTDCGIVEDTAEATRKALVEAAGNADLVISSGGVSVGEEDHVKPAVEALGSLDLWKVQMKPGKPVAFGQISGTPFLGLPGNPVSSFVVFQLLAVPIIQALQGRPPINPVAYPVIADFDKATTSREEYIRVKLMRTDTNELRAQPFPNLSSGVMSSLAWADGLVRQSIDQAIVRGETIDFLPLNAGML